MLQVDHNMWGVGSFGTGRVATLAARRQARLQATTSSAMADGFAPVSGREEKSVAFVEKPLGVPHLARVHSNAGETVYLRFLASTGDDVAVLPDAAQIARQAIEEVRRSGKELDRFVIVGADRLLDEREDGAPGREDAMRAFGSLLRALGEDRVPFVWRTRAGLRGALPLPFVEAWAEVQSLLTIEMGLPCLDAGMVRTLEGPHASDPDSRLRLLSAASARGVSVRAMIDPLVPMLTDQAATLRPLLSALADVGVHRVSCRYLMLTRERARALTERMSSMHRALLRGVFADEPWLRADPERGPPEAHKLLADGMRQKGHDRVVSEASRVGLAVDILDPTGDHEGRREIRRRPKKARPQLDLFGQG